MPMPHVTSLANIPLDNTGRIRQWNACAGQLFGFTSGAALGRHFSFLYGHGEGGIAALLARAAADSCADYEGECTRADGSAFAGRTLVTALREDGRLSGYSLVVHHLAEQAATLPQLRNLHSATLAAGEVERTRIARALRDEIGERLAAIRMDLAWLARRLPEGEQRLADRTEKMTALLDSTVASMRRIATDLRPSELDSLGLVPAVASLLRALSERTGIAAGLDAALDGAALREPLVTGVYRMLQDAVESIATHSRATEVGVALRLDGGRLLIDVRANGRGTGSDSSEIDDPYGVLIVTERAHALGGAAAFGRSGGGGTIVQIAIPVR